MQSELFITCWSDRRQINWIRGWTTRHKHFHFFLFTRKSIQIVNYTGICLVFKNSDSDYSTLSLLNFGRFSELVIIRFKWWIGHGSLTRKWNCIKVNRFYLTVFFIYIYTSTCESLIHFQHYVEQKRQIMLLNWKVLRQFGRLIKFDAWYTRF